MTFTPTPEQVVIYTDGSCHTQSRAGGWVAILLMGTDKIVLSGQEMDTTHNRMELVAVIKALTYLRTNHPRIKKLRICADSQYVIGIPIRKDKLKASGFSTKKGKDIQNHELVTELTELLPLFSIDWVKVKAHEKRTEANYYNIEADKLVRKIVRGNKA